MSRGVDCFAILGLPRRAALEPEVVREAFQRGGKSAHPDAGGDAAEFEQLERAHAAISDPVRRLRHLAELEFGTEPDPGGAISPQTMALFETVGAALASAEDFLKQRAGASSAIARALLAKGEAEASLAVFTASGEVRSRKAALVSAFDQIDQLVQQGDAGVALAAIAECANELAFLTKWEAQLSEKMAALAAG